MKKTIVFIMLAAVTVVFASCRELSRTNPYDPAAPGFINVLYTGESWYPEGTQINAMAFSGGFLYIAGPKQGTGECVIKIADSAALTIAAVTPLGAFSGITDICAGGAGEIYIVDDRMAVQKMDAGTNFTDFAVSNMASTGNLHIEWLGGSVFISNADDTAIYKYSETGTPAVPDSKLLSCTANGYFTPGMVFKAGSYIYVVNEIRKNEVVRLAQDLSDAGVFLFERAINDCSETQGRLEALSGQAVFRVDYNLAVELKWGDYGEGPGKIINGRLISYDATGKNLYILDGGTIKIFGE